LIFLLEWVFVPCTGNSETMHFYEPWISQLKKLFAAMKVVISVYQIFKLSKYQRKHILLQQC